MKILIKYFLVVSFFLPALCNANKVVQVQASPTPPDINSEYTLKLDFSGPNDKVSCGIVVDWGDGEKQKLRVGKGQQVLPPFSLAHTYSSAGTKNIAIKGEYVLRGVSSVGPCDVNFSGAIVVQAPVAKAEEEKKVQLEKAEAEKKAPTVAKGEARALAYKPNFEPPIIQRGQGLTSTEVATAKDDPNFPESDGFSYGLGDSWTTKGGGYYSVNYCWGMKQDKPLLNGIEFSFRDGTNKSSEGACNNLMIYTANLIAGKNVKAKRWNGILGGHWEGTYIDEGNKNKLEYLVLQSSDGLRYGTYLTYEPRGESDIGSSYSQGVFGPPFSTAPVMGKIIYNVVIGGGWSGWGIDKLSMISIDFAKGELTIDSGLYNGGLKDKEDRRSIKTNGPLKFNKENGSFKGTITTFHSPGHGRPPITSTGDVYGYLGGTNAEVIYAVMRLGSAPSRPGINYVIGAAVQVALPQKEAQ